MKKSLLKIHLHADPAEHDLMKAYCMVEKRTWEYRGPTYESYYGKLTQAKVIEVDDKKILKIDIWADKRTSRRSGFVDQPEYTVFLDKEDQEWITWDHTDEKWRNAKLDYLDYTGGWNTFESRKTARIIKEYLGMTDEPNGYNAVLKFQREKLEDALYKRHRRETDEIDEVMDLVPKKPRGFDKWAEEIGMLESRYIYYEYSRKVEKGYCTHCKKEVKLNDQPKHNKYGTCKECHSKIQYKAIKKAAVVWDEESVELLQKMKDGKFVLRRFWLTKRYEDFKKPEFRTKETTRGVLNSMLDMVQEYEWGRFKSSNELRWCKAGSSWHGSLTYRGRLFTSNLQKELSTTDIKYIPLGKFYVDTRENGLDVKNVLNTCQCCPDLVEKLLKAKMYKLGKEVLEKGRWQLNEVGININEKDIRKIFTATKEQLSWIQKNNWGHKELKIMQKANAVNVHLTEIEVLKLKQLDEWGNVIPYLKFTTPHKMIRYIEKQIEIVNQKDYPEGAKKHFAIREYVDYLDMREACGYNMKNQIILFPEDLERRHQEMVEETNAREAELRLIEVRKKYPNVQNCYKRLNEQYGYQKGEYIIRPAASAEEIVIEGRTLHHCVGGNNYINNHDKGNSFILMLRKKVEPDTPYITVEIGKDGSLKQWYGAYDKKPDKKKMETWINGFIKEIAKRTISNNIDLQKAV